MFHATEIQQMRQLRVTLPAGAPAPAMQTIWFRADGIPDPRYATALHDPRPE